MSKFTDIINKGVGAALAVGHVFEWPFRAMFGPPSVEKKAKQQIDSTLSQKFFDTKIGKPLSFILRPKYFYQGLDDKIRTKEIDIGLEFIGTTEAVPEEKYTLDQYGVPIIDPITNQKVLEGVYPTIYRKYRVNVNNKAYGPIDNLIVRAYNLTCYPDDQSKMPLPDSIIIGSKNAPNTVPQGRFSQDITLWDSPIYLGAPGTPLVTKKPAHLFINQLSAIGYDKTPCVQSSTQASALSVSSPNGCQVRGASRKQLFNLNNLAWPRIETKSQRVAVAKWVGRFATVAALIIGSFKGIAHWSDQRDLMRRQTGAHGVFMPLKKMPMTIEGIEADQMRERAEMAEKHRKEESSILWRMQHPGQAEKNEAARQRASEKRAEQADKGRQEDNKKATDLFKQAAPSGTKQGVPSDQGAVNKKSSSSRTVDYGKGPSRNGSDYGGRKVIRTEPNKYNI